MRNLKKFLALILAFMMTFSLMVTVNAADTSKDFTDGVTEKFVEGVKVLNGMKVFRGYEDGSFQPKGEITRAEAAAIVYRLATGDYDDTQAHLYKDYQNFTDVASTDWYAGYVNYCANAEWIAGYGNGKFGPNDKVTGYQAAAMILRAVGYGKNEEFKGASWQVQVANVTRSEGLLKNVDNTNYANTLNQPASRELVAEILFQAAQIPTVTWTMLNGYNKYTTPLGVNGELNPSLGVKNYGLTSHTGIIVGNQATGEARTKVSMSIYNIGKDTAPVWAYNGGSYVYDSANNGTSGNVTLAYSAETDLDLFGHNATVWFDNRSDRATEKTTGLDTNFATSYAVIDRATLVKTVWADDLTNNGKVTNKTSVYSAAVAAGFNKDYAPGWESDRFCQIGPDDASHQAIPSKVGMYRIISNSANKAADVVISLNQEVAKITQVNTTIVDGEYIYLGKGNSKFGDGLASPGTPDGKILDDLLAPGSDKTLGDVVTVNEIVGTTWTGMTGDETTNAGNERTIANAGGLSAQFCLYETKKLEPAFTGTISTYTLEGSDVVAVTMSDGKAYDLSGITGANVNSGKHLWNFDSATHLIDGALRALTSSVSAGVTYTFYLDEVGRFIGVESPNEYEFVYGTYADYTVGDLGSAEMSYYISGFDWNGSLVKNRELVSYNGGARLYKKDNNLYNTMTVSRKDLGAALGGNQITNGYNTGYMMNKDGDIVPGGNGGMLTSTKEGTLPTGSTNKNTWVISSTDASNGFSRVKNYPDGTPTDYLLTNDTKFIVVSGIGVNATAKVYNGIKELVGTNSSVEIFGHDWDPTLDSGNGDVAYNDEVWFQTEKDVYGNVDTSKNNTIKTVIMSTRNLAEYGAQSMYFAAPGATATGVKLAGCTDSNVNQYKLYSNGVANYYWVKDNADDPATGTAVKGDFYTLIQIDTISGQPIYKATQVTDTSAGSNHVDATYNYVVVNNVNTAEIVCGVHNSTTDTKVYKVDNAVVAEAYGTNETTIIGDGNLFPNGTNIKDVLTLNHAVSMGRPGGSGNLYTVTVAIVYEGINVSCIYVTNIA